MVFFQPNVSVSGRLLNDSGSIICETSSPLLLLVWVARRSIPKMLASFSSLPSIFGYLVLKQRDEKHNWTRHHEKTLYLRTGVHTGSVGLVSIWSLRSLRKKSSAIIWKPLSSGRSDNDRWDRTFCISAIVVAAIAGEVSIWLQRSHSAHVETGLDIGQARALCYKQFLDILLTVLYVLSIQTEWKPQLPPLSNVWGVF